MDNYCRGCLNKSDTDLLQYTEKNRRLFVYCTGLQVKRNDSFTFQLCKDCYLNMKLACKFKKQCRNSDKKLKNYLALNETGDATDFNNFLKNNDDALVFRLPLMSGSSTPANHRAKDDDNESTCTSIRNFMTDMSFKVDDIPDTEARIIREVIQEEADILEDSLDSHWLQDDVSIDTDFRLDFSFSPFSTPRVNNGQNCTPKKFNDEKAQHPKELNYALMKFLEPVNEDTCETIDVIKDLDDMNNENNIDMVVDSESQNQVSIPSLNESGLCSVENELVTENLCPIETENIFAEDGNVPESMCTDDISVNICAEDVPVNMCTDDVPVNICADDVPVNICTEEVPVNLCAEDVPVNICAEDVPINICAEDVPVNIFTENASVKTINAEIVNTPVAEKNIDVGPLLEQVVANIETPQCTIDRNLEEALKNTDNKEFSLDDLLVSPPVFPGVSAPSTPTIANILFGEKLDGTDDNSNSNIQKTGHCIEQFEVVKGDEVLDEFFNGDTNEENLDKEINTEIKEWADEEMETKEIKIELIKEETEEIKTKQETVKQVASNNKQITSPSETKFDITNFYCKMCNIKLKSIRALKIHFTTYHKSKILLPKPKPDPKPMPKPRRRSSNSTRICNYCGKIYTHLAHFITHLKTHEDNTQYVCKQCSLTFSSESKLNMHMVTHTGKLITKDTGERHVCNICGAVINKRSNYYIHMKRHKKVYTIECQFCGKGFARKSDLESHTRSHTGERPFACRYCPKSFSRRDTLNKHTKTHTDEKLHQCKHCDARFVNTSTLNHHLLTSKTCEKKRHEIIVNALMKINDNAEPVTTPDDFLEDVIEKLPI